MSYSIVGGLVRQPAFQTDPLQDQEGLKPSVLQRALMIDEPAEFSPDPRTLVRRRSFNAGVEIGAGRGMLAGAALGVALCLILRKVF